MNTKKIVLLVDDDLVDQTSVKRAFKELNIDNDLYIANNGEEAIEFLRNKQNKEVGIILLDLNMPKMNGLEFLKIVKMDKVLQLIPIVILTTSNEESGRIECFKNGAAGYLLKKFNYDSFLEVIRAFNRYWTISEFPNG